MSPSESARQSKSTGPRTAEGKAKSSLNAMRHGLTGRSVVLPAEDMNAYHAFCADLMQDLKPETPLERQYAQTFCDTQWRLNRARAIEDSMLGLGHFAEVRGIDVEHPEAHAALAAAQTFRENSKAFVNLSLYEQRLQRTLKESLRQLQELQAERRASRQAALDDAVAVHNLRKTKGESDESNLAVLSDQFVFSTSEIEAEARRRSALAEARKLASSVSPVRNLSERRQSPLAQAA